MINDIENEVYTKLANILRAEFDTINLSSSYVRTPTAFPHVCIVQQDSINIKQYWTDENEYDEIMFEINIYSNKANSKKTECKAIAKVISNAMAKLNFRRISMNPVPNLEDASIYRIVARFNAVTDGKYIYRR